MTAQNTLRECSSVIPVISQDYPKVQKVKKIALFLPIGYRGGSLRGAKNIAKMLFLGSKACDHSLEVVFSFCEGAYPSVEVFSDLLELGISIRETKWTKIAKRDFPFMGNSSPSKSLEEAKEYSLPTDGIANFSDCDFWLLISDRLDPPLAPLVPYGIVVYDYIQRYVPELFSKLEKGYLTTARNASFVITTTPQTQNDTIQYAGIDPRKVTMIPMDFCPPLLPSTSVRPHHRPYFLWVTNTSPHKNHLRSLQALEIFYKQYDGVLDVVMVGIFLDLFQNPTDKNPYPYTREISKYIEQSPVLKEKCQIKGEVTDQTYANLLAHAEFLWHPTLVDNGTFAVVEAAYLGVASVSSDYPAMRYMNERFDLDLLFFDAFDSQDIARKLASMSKEAKTRRAALPSPHHLDQFTAERSAQDFWTTIRERIYAI